MMGEKVKQAAEDKAERFLDQLSDDYPYRIEGSNAIPGEEAIKFGDCISRPIPEGRRTWAFADASARDAFAASLEAPPQDTMTYGDSNAGLDFTIRPPDDDGYVWLHQDNLMVNLGTLEHVRAKLDAWEASTDPRAK